MGNGFPALKYLIRYLYRVYREVIAEKNILSCQDGEVTFRYLDSGTGQTCTRTLKGEYFLWLVLQHVLPKGFRRVRDYGFLHGNARRLLCLVQFVLRVLIEPNPLRPRPVFQCPRCKAVMEITAFRGPVAPEGTSKPTIFLACLQAKDPVRLKKSAWKIKTFPPSKQIDIFALSI